ncbi:hypothetical protein HanIR_Chr12g0593021 [Helianthus annuus]|nr:hypothetical protein HanIR_Chr12g0593021 [Helianthus annuus]
MFCIKIFLFPLKSFKGSILISLEEPSSDVTGFSGLTSGIRAIEVFQSL